MKPSVFFDFMRSKGKEVSSREIGKVVIDSRNIEKNDIFVAIRGGNSFAGEALEKGAAFVIYDSSDVNISEADSIQVADSIEFLQEMASFYRKALNPMVIAITGSNGKTTTKDILYSIMAKKWKGKKTEGNYNNHIGLPYTLMQLEEDDKFIILEMGMSGFGEIELLAKIAEPDYGIITNIGHSHLEHLKTRENIFKAKTELIPFVKKESVVSGDDEFLKECSCIKAGKNGDVTVENIVISEEGAAFELNLNGKKLNIKTNLTGEHNVINEAMAAAMASLCGVTEEEITVGLKEVEISKMRFQKIEKEGTVFINDAYNASPMSMQCAIETFSKMYLDHIRIVVLGDMLELGDESINLHKSLKQELEKAGFDYIFLYGENMKYLCDAMEGSAEHFSSKREIAGKIAAIEGKKAVLLKGSRGMKLEEILKNN